MVYRTYNYTFHRVYKSIYNVWGPHIVSMQRLVEMRIYIYIDDRWADGWIEG